MNSEKKFYWIKLKTDFFSRKDIDFLLSQKNGAEYVVIYQILCLSTANSNGELKSTIGEIIVPFDIDKVVRECKYYDIDTVRVAMSLYRKLGLIYEQDDGTLKISNYQEMVGSEAGNANAQRQKRFRERQKQLKLAVTNSNDNSNTNNNEEIDNREKSKDIREEENQIIEYEIEEEEPKVPYKEIIEYLNSKTNKNYKPSSNKNRSVIDARFNEGYTLEDFKRVIDIKTEEWLNTDFEQFLRPETLFSNKFDGYLNQVPKSERTPKRKDKVLSTLEAIYNGSIRIE